MTSAENDTYDQGIQASLQFGVEIASAQQSTLRPVDSDEISQTDSGRDCLEGPCGCSQIHHATGASTKAKSRLKTRTTARNNLLLQQQLTREHYDPIKVVPRILSCDAPSRAGENIF